MGRGMTAAALMVDLMRLGIRLEARGDRLRFHPQSAVTPDLAEQLKANKAELLRLVAQRNAAAHPPATIENIDELLRWEPAPFDPQSICPCHTHTRFWRSAVGGHIVCGECHPPATESVVAEWVTFPDRKPTIIEQVSASRARRTQAADRDFQ